jgi:hypothetical protein
MPQLEMSFSVLFSLLAAVVVALGAVVVDAGLTHFLPLASDYSDQVSGTPATVLGDASCASFVDGVGWYQSCTASLQIPDTGAEAGDVSVCAFFSLSSFPSNVALFSCEGFRGGTEDCIEARLANLGSDSSPNPLLVGQVSVDQGGGSFDLPPFQDNSWHQLCITYQDSSATNSQYFDGAFAASFTAPHGLSTYGAPVLAGDGSGSSVPNALGVFRNWRVFDNVLSASDVASYYAQDNPSSPPRQPAGGGTSGGLSRFLSIAQSAGSRLVRVAAITDSIGWGLYASNSSTFAGDTCWTSLLRTQLQAQYGDGGSGFVSASHSQDNGGGPDYTLADVGVFDNNQGAWPANYFDCSGDIDYTYINHADVSTTVAQASYTFRVRGTSILVYYVANARGPLFTVAIDGYTPTTFNSHASSNTSTYQSFSVPAGTHVVTVTHSGSDGQLLVLQGVDATYSTGVVVDLYGTTGQTLQTFVCTPSAISSSGGSSGARPASLLVLELGYNDAAGGASAQVFSGYLQQLLAQFQGVDVLYVEPAYQCRSEADCEQYQYCSFASSLNGYASAAVAVSNAFANASSLFTSCDDAQDKEYYGNSSPPHAGDPIGTPGIKGVAVNSDHPSDVGHAQIFSLIAPLLQSTYTAPPTAPPPPPPTQGLLHDLPLMGSFIDNTGSSSLIFAAMHDCNTFAAAGSVSNAYTQTCQGASLSIVDYAAEGGDFSSCVAAYVPEWTQQNEHIIGCQFGTASDCGIVRYDSIYDVLVFEINNGGPGDGVVQALPNYQWFHLCVTYQASSSTLSGYYNGVPLVVVTAPHATMSTGVPVIGGDSGPNTGPTYSVVGSFVNFKVYNELLSASQVAALAAADTPSN